MYSVKLHIFTIFFYKAEKDKFKDFFLTLFRIIGYVQDYLCKISQQLLPEQSKVVKFTALRVRYYQGS